MFTFTVVGPYGSGQIWGQTKTIFNVVLLACLIGSRMVWVRCNHGIQIKAIFNVFFTSRARRSRHGRQNKGDPKCRLYLSHWLIGWRPGAGCEHRRRNHCRPWQNNHPILAPISISHFTKTVPKSFILKLPNICTKHVMNFLKSVETFKKNILLLYLKFFRSKIVVICEISVFCGALHLVFVTVQYKSLSFS